ncbi:Mu-like prophage I protein [Rhodovulum sp. P5]|uniref:phage protease n=1 Tax=Rhodovulum sp. P5 TaxID=1564506 RepID=UPI0009C35F99|nr:phage protease [Rhodovulum sp. P5]ARE38349.1 Mu-like prophage I protein [Rhodovulum sp. P5]
MSADQTRLPAVPLADTELACAAAGAESWVQLLPAGEFPLVDRRGPWRVTNAAAVIARSQGQVTRGMPVDMDHALDRKHESEAPAAGWIEELAAREDGIWARIAWTPTGKAKIEGREYRFISPVVQVAKGEVMAIQRAGLTNDPAIPGMQALCAAEDAPADFTPEDVVELLREALGAPADAPVDALIAQIRAIIATADGLRTDTGPAKELASSYISLLSEVHEGRVEAALERARASGKLVPAMEGWAKELATANLASFEAWEANAQPAVILGPALLAGKVPPAALTGATMSAERRAVRAQLGLDD